VFALSKPKPGETVRFICEAETGFCETGETCFDVVLLAKAEVLRHKHGVGNENCNSL